MDDTQALWSAPAARSDDGALATGQPWATRVKAVSRFACHRIPKSLAASRNCLSSHGLLSKQTARETTQANTNGCATSATKANLPNNF